MDCCNDAHRTLLALTGLPNQFGSFGLVMPYMKPLFNLWISYNWHKDFWRMLFTYVQQFSVWKINVLHQRDRGKLLWGKYSTWLAVSRTWIILTVLGSTCYHLTQDSTCRLLPEASSVHHRTPAALQSTAGFPLDGWWGRSVSTLFCNTDSVETHDPVTQQAWPA